MMSQGKNIRRAALATCVFVLAFAGIAVAETTRDEYKAQAEPICKKNKEETEKFLKGVKTMVKKDKLKQAGTSFSKAAGALERTEKKLAEIEPPTADSAKITKWLSEIKGEVSLMKTIAAKFKSGNKAKGSALVVKLTHNATVANKPVIGFEFKYCKTESSQFS